MQICKLTLLTAVDGQETKITRIGKIACEDGKIFLQYREENAQIHIMIKENCAVIERTGDYSLYLSLAQGAKSTGRISINGSEGELPVKANTVYSTQKKNQTVICLQYQLLFGEEMQDMRLRITAQTRGKNEN